MQKLYYSISELSEIVDEEQYILRYWEKEFEQLSPRKNRAGNRIYSEKDLSIIKLIKKLLRQDKLSLKGAKEYLEKLMNSPGGIESILINKYNEIDNDYFYDRKENTYTDKGNEITLKKEDAVQLYKILNEVLEILRK